MCAANDAAGYGGHDQDGVPAEEAAASYVDENMYDGAAEGAAAADHTTAEEHTGAAAADDANGDFADMDHGGGDYYYGEYGGSGGDYDGDYGNGGRGGSDYDGDDWAGNQIVVDHEAGATAAAKRPAGMADDALEQTGSGTGPRSQETKRRRRHKNDGDTAAASVAATGLVQLRQPGVDEGLPSPPSAAATTLQSWCWTRSHALHRP